MKRICGYRHAGKIDANQPRYSMLDRTIETELAPYSYCLKHNISLLVYSPLEQGLLTGKIGMDKKFAESEYRNNITWFRPENRRPLRRAAKVAPEPTPSAEAARHPSAGGEPERLKHASNSIHTARDLRLCPV